MSSISANSPFDRSNVQNVLGSTQDNAHPITQSSSDDISIAAGSRLAVQIEKLDSFLPIPQQTPQKPSSAQQRWEGWRDANHITSAQQKQRQRLAAQLKDKIQFIGERIVIKGDLNLQWLYEDITSLPEGLVVQNDLVIDNYSDLTSLPAGLVVLGNLVLIGCDGLTSLPENLVVKGNLEIKSCPNLTSLPLSILRMLLQSGGMCRKITLEDTGITYETHNRIKAWLAEQPNHEQVQLYWGKAMANHLDDFKTLRQALDHWIERYASLHDAVDPSMLDNNLSPGQQDILRRFLSMLRGTTKAKRLEQYLAERVKVLIQALQASPNSIMITDVLHKAISSCHDRIIVGLDSAHQVLQIAEAERTGKQQLYKLGLSLLKLEVVHQYARDQVKNLVSVDELEIYLRYEIKLAKQLDLPIQTRAMLCEGCAKAVTEKDIEQAAAAANAAVSDTQRVQEWMLNWAPMQRFQASKLPWMAWHKLEETKLLEPIKDRQCCLTLKPYHKLTHPCTLLGSEHFLADHNELERWCKEHQIRPDQPGVQLDLKALRRLPVAAETSQSQES